MFVNLQAVSLQLLGIIPYLLFVTPLIHTVGEHVNRQNFSGSQLWGPLQVSKHIPYESAILLHREHQRERLAEGGKNLNVRQYRVSRSSRGGSKRVMVTPPTGELRCWDGKKPPSFHPSHHKQTATVWRLESAGTSPTFLAFRNPPANQTTSTQCNRSWELLIFAAVLRISFSTGFFIHLINELLRQTELLLYAMDSSKPWRKSREGDRPFRPVGLWDQTEADATGTSTHPHCLRLCSFIPIILRTDTVI